MPCILRELTKRVVLVLVLLGWAMAAEAGAGRFTPIGPEGGDVWAIRVEAGDSRVVYAAARLGGVFKSTDGGESWRHLPGAPTDDEEVVLDLVLDPTAPGTLYVAHGRTVLKSRDGGATFTDAGSGLENVSHVQALALDPARPAELYAGTYDGLFRSADGGASWQLAPDLAGLFITSITLDPAAPDTLFVGVEDYDRGGVWKSRDGGATWERKTQGLPPTSFGEGVVQVVADPQGAGRLYAAYVSLNRNPGRPTEDFRSTDGGETWSEMPGAGDYPLAAARGGLVQAGSRRSTDGGVTWTGVPVPGTPLSSLTFDPRSPGVIYAGSSARGVVKSADAGRSWRSINRGLWATEVSGLAVDTRAPGVLYTGVLGGQLWALPLARGSFRLQAESEGLFWPFRSLVPDPRTPRVLYADFGGEVQKSVDGGRSFTLLDVPKRPAEPCFEYSGLAIDPASPEVLYAGGDPYANRCDTGCDTWRSGDGGATWSCMNGLDRFQRIYAPPLRQGSVFAVTDQGIFASPNSGASWRLVRQNPPEQSALALAFDPRRVGVVYAGIQSWGRGEEGIWRSVDGGATWSPWSRGFPLPVGELIVDPNSPSTLYAGVKRSAAPPSRDLVGVYRSTDAGRTWHKIPGLPGALYDSELAFDPIRGTLYAGTLGQGAFAASFPIAGSPR